jgi:hypothetical protein
MSTENLPRRRRVDHGWRRLIRENWYRDVWLLIISACVAWAAWSTVNLADDVNTGRRQGIGITCGATNAVIDAGRAAIGTPTNFPPALERNLRQLGFPPREQREQASRRAAEQYARSIATGVVRNAKDPRKARDVVRPDGSLDCDRLAAVANAN